MTEEVCENDDVDDPDADGPILASDTAALVSACKEDEPWAVIEAGVEEELECDATWDGGTGDDEGDAIGGGAG